MCVRPEGFTSGLPCASTPGGWAGPLPSVELPVRSGPPRMAQRLAARPVAVAQSAACLPQSHPIRGAGRPVRLGDVRLSNSRAAAEHGEIRVPHELLELEEVP